MIVKYSDNCVYCFDDETNAKLAELGFTQYDSAKHLYSKSKWGKDKLLYLISIAVYENGPSYDIDVYLDDVTSEQGEENFREANAILEKAKKIIGGKEDVA